MDLTSLQIEGISRSSFNLDNYDFSTKQVSQIFKHGETPSSKRKLATTQRWDFLNKKCEEFHNLELRNLKLIPKIMKKTFLTNKIYKYLIPLTEFYVKNAFEICLNHLSTMTTR